jgi:prepilin-type N-terminal cleavage/methylation domain-containing protein
MKKTLRFRRSESGFTLIEIAIVMIIVSLLIIMLLQLAETYIREKREAKEIDASYVITAALSKYIVDESIPDDTGTPPNETYWDPSAHYPCPADPTLRPGDANFGVSLREHYTTGAVVVEQEVGNDLIVDPTTKPVNDPVRGGITCASGPGTGVIAIGTAPERIFVGAVPTRTLDIDSSYMLDGWGHKYTYAVSESAVLTLSSSKDRWAASATTTSSTPPYPLGHITINQYQDDGTPDTPITNAANIYIMDRCRI